MVSDKRREARKDDHDAAASGGTQWTGDGMEASPEDLTGVEPERTATDAHYHFLLEFCHTHPGSHEPKPPHWRRQIELEAGRPVMHDAPDWFLGFLASREGFGIKKDLVNVRALLGRMGLLERTPPVVLVAGTNGKGTTATAVAEALATVGYRPGLYTSPHVERFLERIQVMGGDPDDEVLEAACRRVMDETRALDEEGLHATYFEVATALALAVFRRHRASPWVLEVGMGGRLDAVNALSPMLCLITGVGTDHLEHLGSDLAARAREKAGIMRPGVPCFTTADGVALDALRRHAGAVGTPLVSVTPRDAAVPADSALRSLVRSALTDPVVVKRLPRLDRWEPSSLVLPRLPGRRESWRFPAGANVLLDVAHNEEAFAALAAHVAATGVPPDKRVLLVGLLGDKDPVALARLAALFGAVVTTRPDSARAMDAGALRDALVVAGCSPDRVEAVTDPLAALQSALRRAPRDGLVVVAGSFYLAGAVRPALREVAQRA